MKRLNKLHFALLSALTSVVVVGCNNTGEAPSQSSNSTQKTNAQLKYDNDQVKGVWAVANGYDGGSINPTLNMLAQNNTDSIMSFVGCDDVQGSEKAEYNLSAFKDEAISYTSTFPSIYQNYANMTTGGEYLMDKLTNQPTLQTIKFNGDDYHGDNKKQCYYAIINKDNKEPMYVKLTLDTKLISTYDPTGLLPPWQSKPLEEMQSASKETKNTVQKLIDPQYTQDSGQLKNLTPAQMEMFIHRYLSSGTDEMREKIILQFLAIELLSNEGIAKDVVKFNALLNILQHEARGLADISLRTSILREIKMRYVVSNSEIRSNGAFKINEDYYEYIEWAANMRNDAFLEHAIVSVPVMDVERGTNRILYHTNVVNIEHNARFTHAPYLNFDNDQDAENRIFEAYDHYIEGGSSHMSLWLHDNLVHLVDKEFLEHMCNYELFNNGICTPLQDAVKNVRRSDVADMSVLGKKAFEGTDVPGRVVSEAAQKELAIKTIAEARGTAGGLVTKNALKDIFHFMPKSAEHPDVGLNGLDLLLSLGGGPVSVAVQLVISEAIAWATHSVDAPIYNIRVTGMKWEPVTADDATRWNGSHKDSSILANTNVVTLTDSSFSNMVRVSYKPDPKEPRDNQLNYTLTLDPITTPFVRAVQDQPDPWLGNVTSHMGESNVDFAKLRSSGSQEGSAVMSLTLNKDSDKFQDNDVYKFVFQQLGMDAYIPQYLPKPEVGNTTVTSFGGNKLDLSNLHAKPSISHSGLALTKISDNDQALFISPGTVVKLGLTIPKSSNPNDPSAATRLMASYDAINPQTGAIISYGQIGSQSMFNALTESKDSLPLLMTAFDCSFPYEAGKTCNATFAMSSQNIKTKGDGKLYIQDANGDYNPIPIHMGYSVYPQPWEFDGEAGSKHKLTLTLSDVSAGNAKEIWVKAPNKIVIQMARDFRQSCDTNLQSLIKLETDNSHVQPKLTHKSKVNIADMLNNKGKPQTTNVNTVTPPQCKLPFSLEEFSSDGSYNITVTTVLKDGTKDVQVIPVEVKEPL